MTTILMLPIDNEVWWSSVFIINRCHQYRRHYGNHYLTNNNIYLKLEHRYINQSVLSNAVFRNWLDFIKVTHSILISIGSVSDSLFLLYIPIIANMESPDQFVPLVVGTPYEYNTIMESVWKISKFHYEAHGADIYKFLSNESQLIIVCYSVKKNHNWTRYLNDDDACLRAIAEARITKPNLSNSNESGMIHCVWSYAI